MFPRRSKEVMKSSALPTLHVSHVLVDSKVFFCFFLINSVFDVRRLTYEKEDLSYIVNVHIFNLKSTAWLIGGSVEQWHRPWGSLGVRGQSLNSAPTLLYISFSIWTAPLTVLTNVACKVDMNSRTLKPPRVDADVEPKRTEINQDRSEHERQWFHQIRGSFFFCYSYYF